MEPDLTQNVEKSGFSRRRISSILKAPRKSVRYPDPEQQENVVECAKPGEKRNSRRVSFAPANDVLLFSKDVKNTSPARCPFQDLTATAVGPTLNRGQAGDNGDGGQKIAGMESLLNAPLHDHQHKDKVIFETGDDFGERTVMFSTHDASMDMTQSHTFNIATDADVLEDGAHQNNDIFSTVLDKRVMFPVDSLSADKTHSHSATVAGASILAFAGRKLDQCVEKKKVSASAPCLDPDFENFLASLSEPSGPSVDAAIARATHPLGSSAEDKDKENLVPPPARAAIGKPVHNSRSSGLLPAARYSEEKVIDAPRGDDDVDPFQWLFPSQDMYAHSDRRVSQTEIMKSNRQQTRKSVGLSDSKDKSFETTHTQHKVGADFKEEPREKTVLFTADEMFMDLTQAHTVHIACGSEAPQPMSANTFNPGFENVLVSHSQASDPASIPVIPRTTPTAAPWLNEGINTNRSLSLPSAHADEENEPLNQSRSFGRSLSGSTICPKDVGVVMTEPRGRTILRGDLSMDKTESRMDTTAPLQQAFSSRATHSNDGGLRDTGMSSYQQRRETTGPRDCKDMGTPYNTCLKKMMEIQQVKCDAEFDCKEKTVRFTADDACMDLTQSLTVNIRSDAHLHSHQNENFLPVYGEKTVRFTDDDAAMDVTKSHTVNIAIDIDPNSQNLEFLPVSGEKNVRFTDDGAAMDVTKSHTVNIATVYNVQSHGNVGFASTMEEKPVKLTADDAAKDETRTCSVDIATDFKRKSEMSDHLPNRGEQTLRFSSDDAAMDMTKSHTVNIAADYKMSLQNVHSVSPREEIPVKLTTDDAPKGETRNRIVDIAKDFKRTSGVSDLLQSSGEKTVRFTADDAAMDVTKSHTVNIATVSNMQWHQNVDFVSTREEKPVRLTTDDAAKDEPRHRTVDIVTDFKRTSQSEDNLPNSGERTVRFTADDAAMDVTKCHTVNIATSFQPQLPNVDPPAFEEKTVRFSASDAGMDMTQCLTVNIASNSSSDSRPLHQNALPVLQNLDIPSTVKKEESDACVVNKERSVCLSEGELLKAEATDKKSTYTRGSLFQPQMKKPDINAELEATLASAVMEKSVNGILPDCADISSNMDLTEAQTGHIMEQTFTNQIPRCVSLTQNQDFEHSMAVQSSPVRSEAPGPSCLDNVAIANLPGSPDSSEKESFRESEPSRRSCPVTQNVGGSPSAVDQDADMVNSRKSRRISLADLTSKVRRLSHMINAAPDPVATESCTMPWTSLEHDWEKNSEEKLTSAPVEPELKRVQTEDISQDQCVTTTEQVSAPIATPFNLKTKQLMSRLSVGGFKPKLPQRSKPEDSTKGKLAMTVLGCPSANVPNHLSNFDNDVSDIFDEELGSYEDTSEILDVHGHVEKIPEQESAFEEFDFRTMDMFDEDFIGPVHRQKRSLPEDENIDNEKRMKTSTDAAEMVSLSDVVDSDSNVTTAATTTQTIESSISSHTASMRCEATFESTYKQSFYESQLEDHASEMQMKLEDGTITVMEFFKIFNIDFVIHNPRQSVRPARLLSETEFTAMDLLKNRHISRPKQMVYETDVLDLTHKVDRLKVRMEDLDKPLKAINHLLWEEIRRYSERELKSFGVKLKERNNFFRKTSKAQSHEMKEVLYTKLVQAHLEEQEKLKETIEKADDMLKSLDDCIHQLQTELAGVEENGFDGKPSMKSLQDEITKATETLGDNERRKCELEMQQKQNSGKLKRLNAETQNLESHMDALEILNEWKLKESGHDCTLYSFLHETMTLQLTYEKSDGNPADNESARKTKEIRFNFELDDEKSRCHARLAHKLLSQFTGGESAWVEKFPTSGHVPKLLRDVGQVVSRCRLLGEECQRLKLWGSLPFDIVHISCDDTRICIVFSSLKTFSKFQVVFAVSLINRLCVLKVESFKNIIGGTTMEQIEEIVASFTPGQNLLTSIVKKIHQTLLC